MPRILLTSSSFLYRSCSSVELEKLSGGFSGALVLKVTAVDSLGHKLPPNVVKLGPTKLISREMVSFHFFDLTFRPTLKE